MWDGSPTRPTLCSGGVPSPQRRQDAAATIKSPYSVAAALCAAGGPQVRRYTKKPPPVFTGGGKP
ncbi:MAG: hypothetical protein FWG05_03450, partial [Kiritimatiellaeota bacterium]|nr:hypothetical protein [Kiritimatiellota bacterium]